MDLASVQVKVDAQELVGLKDTIDKTGAAYASMVARVVAENKRMESAVKASAAAQEEAIKRLAQKESSSNQDSWFAQQRRRIQMMEASARLEEKQAQEQQRLAEQEIRKNKAVLDSFVQAQNQKIAAERRSLIMASQREAAVERQLAQEARVAAAVQRSAAVQQRAGHGMSRFGQVTQQTGYQVGDFIVQVQSGTNAWVAAGQQLTQLAGLMYLSNVAWMTLAGTVASITIPLITAIGAYYSRTQEATEKTKELKTAIQELDEVTKNLSVTLNAFRFGVDEAEVRSVMELNNAVAERARLEQELNSLYNGRSLLIDAEEQAKAKALKQELSIVLETERANRASLESYRKTREEVERRRAEQDKALEEQRKSQELIEALVNSQLAAMQGLTGALSAAKSQAASFVGVADSLAGALGRAASAWGVILGGPITGAPGAVARYEASGSADAAARNNAMTMGKDGGRLAAGAGGIRNFPGSGDGGGGGGGGGTNPLIAELESLQDFLRTEAELEIESYTERQETLRSALDQKLLTLQEYNQLEKELKMKHDEEMAQLDAYRYGNGLAVTKQWFGDMANAFQSGGERMARIGRVLNAAIALQNSYVAFTEVLKDPAFIGRPFARFAAASAILAQGLSAVAAIKGSGGGSGGSGGGSVGSIQSTRQASAQTVYISGLAPDALFTGEMLQELFNSFYKENDNRGKVFVVAR